LGKIGTKGARGISVRGQYAYVADYENGLLVVDISDKSNPVQAMSLETGAFAQDTVFDGNQLYVADSWGGLRILNVKDTQGMSASLLMYLLN
jgi:hypothetical protein